MNRHLPIFVYGTLKRGEEREAMWPRWPVRVEAATTLGILYDIGPYPALAAGDDVVEGERLRRLLPLAWPELKQRWGNGETER